MLANVHTEIRDLTTLPRKKKRSREATHCDAREIDISERAKCHRYRLFAERLTHLSR